MKKIITGPIKISFLLVNVYLILHNINPKLTVKNILVLQSRIEILVTVPGLGHGVAVCGFHTRPLSRVILFSHGYNTNSYRVVRSSLPYNRKCNLSFYILNKIFHAKMGKINFSVLLTYICKKYILL